MSKWLLILMLCSYYPSLSFASPLTLERIYSDPSLSGPRIKSLKMSPDGKIVTYLKSSRDGQVLRSDLWKYNLKTKDHAKLIDSKSIEPRSFKLSDDEKARRERQRITSVGITTYQWDRKGEQILIPLAGDIFLYDLASGKTKRITKTESFETDAKISPKGGYVSYVREQNLVIYSIRDGKETLVTSSGGGSIRFGQAEFIAQEKMRRYTGYWWSPDDTSLVISRVDESKVALETRYEIYGDELKTIQQRYPKTGTTNAEVSLLHYDIALKKFSALDLGKNKDIYVARVNWSPDSNRVIVQRQSRDQKIIDLISFQKPALKPRTILTETDDRWINLHNDLRLLKSGEIIWKSERNGSRQLYLLSADGRKIRPITNGDGVVMDVSHVDEMAKTLYFTANFKDHTEQHLYRLNYDTGRVTRISDGAGIHQATFSKTGEYYIHRFSSMDQLPQTSIRHRDGKLVTFLNQNQLTTEHPYKPYSTKMPKITFGHLAAEDGQKLYYKISKPYNFDQNASYPVIVRVYGGPGPQTVRKQWGGTNGLIDQYLTERGFIVFALDNRGSGNRNAKFEKAIHRQLGDKEIRDQITGVRYLRTLDYVDKNNIGIFGWSYGGYMASMAMAKARNYFKAGVAVAPVTTWDLYDTHYTERFLEHPKDNPKGYQASSVFPYLDSYQDNLLLIHGMADDNVLFTNATKLMTELQKRALPFELMTYPGKKHGIRGKNVRIHLFSQVEEFFTRKLMSPKSRKESMRH
ncbi:MAG: S9 family peptidase [Pseudobacteriovorax sp.]|nr:S9 family peptidase [Pseudobacteriovorax sp.]